MQHYLYLFSLLFSLCGLIAADSRQKSPIITSPSSLRALCATVLILLISDIIGIVSHIFYTNSAFVSGIFIVTPNLPLEEFLLLFLISYLVLIIHNIISKS